jgi:hypothetical protein
MEDFTAASGVEYKCTVPDNPFTTGTDGTKTGVGDIPTNNDST